MIGKVIIGYKAPRELNDQQILDWSKRIKAKEFAIFATDSNYFHYLIGLYPNNRQKISKFLQPIVVLIFDKDSLTHFYSNCSFPGFPNLNWNYNEVFNSFPPKMMHTDSTIGSYNMLNIRKYFRPINDEARNFEFSENIMIVMGSNILRRQNKNLTKLLNQKYSQKIKKNIAIVNSDNLWIYLNTNADY